MHYRLRLRLWALSLLVGIVLATLVPATSNLPCGGTSLALAAGRDAPAEPPFPTAESTGRSETVLHTAVPPLSLDPYRALLEAREAASHGDKARARAALARARALDPGLIEPDLFAATLDMPWALGDAGDRLFAAFRTGRDRFVVQAQTLAGVIWGGLAILVALITLLAVGHASVAARPLHHLLAERFVPALTPRLAAVAAGLVLILPLVLGAGPLASALAVLVLAAPLGARRPLALAAVGACLILALGLAPYVAPSVLRPADFRDQALLLDYADHAPLTPELSARLDQLAKSGNDLALLVHANALQRAQRFAEAEPLLFRFCESRPSDFRGPLSIGNTLMRLGDTRTAVRFFRQAQALAPTDPEPQLNLALAYSQLMQFEMANEALAAARQIDPEAVAAINSANASAAAAPVEAHLRAAELWRLFEAERASLGAEPPASIQVWMPWRGGVLWPLGLALLGVAWHLRRTLAKKAFPGPCAACGRMVCSRCAAQRPGLTLCRVCRKRIGDIPADDALQRLIAAERLKRRGRDRLSRIVWNLLVPGHGLIQAGHHIAAALMYAVIAVTGVAFLTGGHPVVPLPAAPGSAGNMFGPQSYGLMLALALAVTVALSISARPSLGRSTRGRLVPLEHHQPSAARDMGRPSPSHRSRTTPHRDWHAESDVPDPSRQWDESIRADRRTGTDD